jgi:hypothetical protein
MSKFNGGLLMKNISLFGIFIFVISGCATGNFMSSRGPTIRNQTPATIIITTPRSFTSEDIPSANPQTYNIAQTHCQKSRRDAVLISSWIVVFDADYFKFECKKSTNDSTPLPIINVTEEDLTKKLREITQLHKDGILTDEEYQQQKKQLLKKGF